MTKRIVLFLWLSIILFMSGLDAQAGFFTPVDSKDLPRAVDVVKNINEMSVLRLDEVALREYLRNAPVEFQNSGNTLSLDIPLPDGRIETFGLVESSILSPEVAARHPEIKSYTGNGLKYQTAVIRVTLTSAGFHAVILDLAGEEIYFEHYSDDDQDVYFNYFVRDAVTPPDFESGRCLVEDEIHERGHGDNGPQRNNTGGTLRTFRLAMAANGEFTQQNGGTQASSFAAIVNYVATLNLVYRRELSVQFTLVSGTNLVYTDPGTDPYTNDLGMDIDINQTNCDAVIGNANYDIGHIMGYSGPNSGGGLAAFQSVCDNTEKARGGSNEGGGPYAQVFFDQLVLHETGHQFGMSHSYNSVIPVCTTRNPGTSVEPGAGATIMSYGFTCGTDDYFTSTTSGPFLNYHTASYEQADTYIGTISCQTTMATGNNSPVVTMPSAFTIPRSTPFSLTGSADAPEMGDSYTYSWEGTDIGAVVPDASTLDDTTQPPFFRSYAPSTSPTRTYPILSAILDGTNQAKGDKLPSVSFPTQHRLTVRDNNSAGGGLSYGEVTITVDGNIGPFLETTNLAATYPAGSTQNITWSVNGTSTATPTVNILLSVDGGQTFPFTLATATGNDGNEMVTFPNIQTSTARIKVESVGNIFFDISNFNFSIDIPGCTAANSNICPTGAMTFDQGDAGLNLSLSTSFGTSVTQNVFNLTAVSPTGELANAMTDGGTDCQTDWGVENYEVFDFSVSTSGDYQFNDESNSIVYSLFLAAGYNPAAPCAGTFLGSNAFGVLSFLPSRTLSLTECTEYKLVAWTVNNNFGMKTVTISGPGDVFPSSTAPANTGYTYVAVNTVNNQIVAQSPTSDFTSLMGGTYKVYGASYKNGGAAPPVDANPAGWIGQTLAAVQSTECVVFSSNCKSLTVIAGNVCSITSSLAKTDETVFGANDGTITVTASCMGTCGTLQYSLNGGTPQASNVFMGLAPGTYTVVTSNVGAATCSDTQMITINAAGANCSITSSLAKTDETVFGANDGTITVTASCSGTCGTLQYSLNGGTPQASNVFTGLAPGTYTVVTSNVGAATCSDTQMITINAAGATCNITSSLAKTDETVFGANDGTITVTASCSGTCGTLQYSLNGGTPQASNVFTGLAPGTYTVVTSNVGAATCSDTQMITINAAPANCNITSSLAKTDETVFGANDGTITVTASCSGTCGTLQYSLNGGTPQASNVFTGLAPGTYTVVTSNVGAATCSDTQMITINAAGANCSITSSLAKTDETMFGANDGTITVTASCMGTCGTLQYSLNGGTPQASNVFMGLAPGTYTVVTSNVGAATCSDTQMITINAAPANCSITSSLAKTDETAMGANDGTITVTASCMGTCGTLQYSLNGGTPQASNVFMGLAPGTYTVVTSNVGAATCSDTQMITILEGALVTPATEGTVAINCPNNLTSTNTGNIGPDEWEWYELVYDGTPITFEINTIGSDFDAELGIYDAAGNLVDNDDDSAGGGQSRLTLDGLAAGTYYVVIGGFNTEFEATGFGVNTGTVTGNANGDYVLNFVATGCPAPCDGEELNVGCIANVNVTLGAACTAIITPQMVMTGNIECATNIVITVDGGNTNVISGCGTHTYMAEAYVNGELVYTCWGNLFAEDKTNPVIDCPANTSDVTVDFDLQTLTGSLDGTEPTIMLNNYSCFGSFFEPTAGEYLYDLITFTVSPDLPATDVYNIQLITNGFGSNFALFQGEFNPANPCENILGGSDGAYFVDPFGVNALLDQDFRIELPLEPGQTYTIMVTDGLSNFGAGTDYVVGIVSDNGGSFVGGGFSAPQPVAVTLPLWCGDLDLIRFQTPQSWIVNAAGELNFTATRNTFFGGSTAALNAFLDKLALGGIPAVSDNCGPMVVTLSDAVSSAGDCGAITLTRTFTVADRYDGACVGAPRTDVCQQIITFNRPTVFDLVLPPYTATIECDENFPTDGSVGGPDDNPAASVTGYPFLLTASGYRDLSQNYCNLGSSYSDEPRINVCDGTYKFRREWNIIDWCSPADNVIWQQYVKVGDYTGPVISGIPAVINVSTSPFSCLANIAIPCPTITDGNGCSSVAGTTYTVLAFGESFFAGGNLCTGAVVQAPIGTHTLIVCAEDACGNETCEEYTVVVSDQIEPSASCDDELNVSIGGGDVANGIEGIARIFASDVDEGSNDNCGEVTLEVRRNYWRNNTCDASANRWSPWGDFVDFYCCDIDNEITIELRVTDESGNQNICWMVITPEDKLNPYCYAPAPVSLTCSNLPLAFPGDIQAAYDDDFAATSIMMSSIFGGATGTDNCAVDTIVERTPNIQVNDCGWGSITRRFEAWQLRPEGDANGNGAIDINEVFRSTNSCSQLITITEVHDFTIDFPEDADADCGDPDVPTIITTTVGCDVLSVNIGEPVRFSATGDECYKFSITYDVINWCVWDGEYEGLVLPRITEDDGEALPVDRGVEGNERPVVRVVSGFGAVDNNCDNVADGQGIQYTVVIDRRHNDRDGDSNIADTVYDNIPGNGIACIPADQFGRRNYGRYIYTQFVKVYDSTAPVVAVGEYGGPTANCPDLLPGQFGDDDGNCEEAVSIPFSVSDECELFDGAGNLVVSIVSAQLDAFAVDANGDGDIKSNEFVADQNVLSLITDNGDGTYVFAGTFPIITSAMGDNIYHAVRILFEDGCGNQVSETIVFDVIDCKGPAPVCINGLTVTLMPQEEGGCAMAIWASDFEGSPISDCTGQGPELFGGLPRVTKYAIYRAADVEADPNFVPSPDDTGLVLTQDDDQNTVVYVYAFDEEGNYDYCETYVLVQLHVDCGDDFGTIQGVIATENNETVEGVEVSINGGMTAMMVTNTNGTYSFSNLALGGDYSVTPYLNANPLNGVSTFDLVLMSKHVLGVQPLNSPYKRIAADINRSGTITTLDMIQLRKLILNIDTQFANNTSWRFVDAAYEFPVATNPWFEAFPELINENNLAGDVLDADFVGVKIGDVNGNAQANALAGDDRTLNGIFHLQAEDLDMKAGNTYTVAVTAENLNQIEGYQGTLQLSGVELVDIEYGVATAEHFGLRYVNEGMITTSWNSGDGNGGSDAMHRVATTSVATTDVLFSLVLRANEDQPLREALSISSRYTAAEAYPSVLADISPERGEQVFDLGLVFSGRDALQSVFTVYQNTPNPFAATTLIGFSLPQDASATVTISDASGRVLNVVRGDYAAGYNTINLTKEMIQGATGVLTYTVTAGEFTATKKMIAVK